MSGVWEGSGGCLKWLVARGEVARGGASLCALLSELAFGAALRLFNKADYLSFDANSATNFPPLAHPPPPHPTPPSLLYAVFGHMSHDAHHATTYPLPSPPRPSFPRLSSPLCPRLSSPLCPCKPNTYQKQTSNRASVTATWALQHALLSLLRPPTSTSCQEKKHHMCFEEAFAVPRKVWIRRRMSLFVVMPTRAPFRTTST